MPAIRLILVGGFLGAGKTTLLAKAASLLAGKGRRVGLITNDQAAQLVDTSNLCAQGYGVGEVAGGCFCCRFDDLVAAADRLMREFQPDVILTEPVGSCTDLSATVLQPIKRFLAGRYRPAPYSVLADATRLRDMLSGRAKDFFPDSVLYIYSKQLEEADRILLNKADLIAPQERDDLIAQAARAFPSAEAQCVSAQTGEGVAEWLDWVTGDGPAGRKIASVDYDLYADGEAELGWLNARADLRAEKSADWAALARGLMEDLRGAFRAGKGEIAHLKIFLAAQGGAIVMSLTGTEALPALLSHGTMDAAAKDAELIVNARVRLAPDDLRADVEKALRVVESSGVAVRVVSLQSFRPGRPKPTHRITNVVEDRQGQSGR